MQFLKQEQFLPISLEEAWNFFSSPRNLNKITPPDLTFDIKSEVPDRMYEGLFIIYSIKPMLRLPLFWCTEITHIKEREYFIDEQRKGPYRIWHHEHHFKEVPGGVIMTDMLYYDIGKSVIGWLAGKLFVHTRVRQIFKYRFMILENYFSKPTN